MHESFAVIYTYLVGRVVDLLLKIPRILPNSPWVEGQLSKQAAGSSLGGSHSVVAKKMQSTSVSHKEVVCYLICNWLMSSYDTQECG